MRFDDQLQLGLANLWRTKLRTILTTLGVAIGIGALVSMVSFGTGMQKNVTKAFKENDLFTSLYVSPQKITVEDAMSGDVEAIAEAMKEPAPALNDSALQEIRKLSGVEIAYPDIRFPVKVRFRDQETRTNLQAMPAEMGNYKPFNKLPVGRFFESDEEASVILTQRVLEKLKIRLRDEQQPRRLSLEDSLRGMRQLPPDSLLGKEIQIITSVIDAKKLMRTAPFFPLSQIQTPFREETIKLKIVGIRKKTTGFEGREFRSGIIVPQKTAEKIPRLGFSTVWELLGQGTNSKEYRWVYVRVKRINHVEPVKKTIEEMGFGVLSIADQLEDIKKGFIILDTALGAIGTIALIVAALGIINTMVMSILERTREIGIMKAIGGSENEIKVIFFIEAGSIGLAGGIFGLALGYVVTRIANVVANYYIAKQGGSHVDFFYIPSWLILSALAFSILVSLLAGLYPAVRAARVDPVEALRHD